METLEKTTKDVVVIFILTALLVVLSYFIPTEIRCDTLSVKDCIGDCVICPPCPECSSISCQSAEFCQNLGFDKDWFKEVTPEKDYFKSLDK